MKVEILDDILTEESARFCAVLEQVATFGVKEELKKDNFEITVTLTDGETIREINAEYRMRKQTCFRFRFGIFPRERSPL